MQAYSSNQSEKYIKSIALACIDLVHCSLDTVIRLNINNQRLHDLIAICRHCLYHRHIRSIKQLSIRFTNSRQILEKECRAKPFQAPLQQLLLYLLLLKSNIQLQLWNSSPDD
jgi:hypothetical protein